MGNVCGTISDSIRVAAVEIIAEVVVILTSRKTSREVEIKTMLLLLY